jgi:hypothetical protein
MSTRNRIKALERQASACGLPEASAIEERSAATDERVALFEARLPEAMRVALEAAFDDPVQVERLAEIVRPWVYQPFADTAPESPDWKFPRELVGYWLAPNRRHRPTMWCDGCGLRLPLVLPIASPESFHNCPSCGAPTRDAERRAVL